MEHNKETINKDFDETIEFVKSIEASELTRSLFDLVERLEELKEAVISIN